MFAFFRAVTLVIALAFSLVILALGGCSTLSSAQAGKIMSEAIACGAPVVQAAKAVYQCLLNRGSIPPIPITLPLSAPSDMGGGGK